MEHITWENFQKEMDNYFASQMKQYETIAKPQIIIVYESRN